MTLGRAKISCPAHRRLDLRVVGADGHYAVGIDCGAYLEEPEALTRDVYQRTYWALNGWQVRRVSPGPWLEAPEAVLEAIEVVVRL